MLALRTGWDDHQIGAISGRLRRACHWALYAEAVAPTLTKLEEVASTPVSPRMDPRTLGTLLKAKQAADPAAKDLRALLYPEDQD